jgi:hypothetical protein
MCVLSSSVHLYMLLTLMLLLPQLDADAKREFFCEEAWWDVAAMEPFTPACISDVHAE